MLALALFMLPYQAPVAGLFIQIKGQLAFDSRSPQEKGVVERVTCCWEDLARARKERHPLLMRTCCRYLR